MGHQWFFGGNFFDILEIINKRVAKIEILTTDVEENKQKQKENDSVFEKDEKNFLAEKQSIFSKILLRKSVLNLRRNSGLHPGQMGSERNKEVAAYLVIQSSWECTK